MTRHILAAFLLGSFIGAVACGGDPEAGDGETEALSCEHGTFSECACPDGTMGMQLCAHDTSGFEPCMCGGEDETASTTMPGTTASTSATTTSGSTTTSMSTTTSDEESSTEPDDSSSSDPSASTDPTTGGSETGPIGQPPTAMINHPGMEDREVGVPIPFIGVADDPEDGALSGMSMVWTDDLEGEIGTGEMFDAALQTLGDHVVTLTVTDSDGNVTEDSIAFEIVAP